MTDWTIKKADSSWSLSSEDADNISNLRRNLTAGGQDSFEFKVTGKTMSTDAVDWVYGDDVIVEVGDPAARWFRGTITSNPRMASSADESQRITISGPMHLLSRCTYMQTWVIYDESGDENVNVNKSRVILNQDSTGARITTGAQIEDVIDFAISKGVAIAKGTIDTGTELPFDERTNMTCADVINTMLRYLPDHVAWFDYSTTPNPTFHCRKKANLTACSKALTDGDLLDMRARSDLQIPGVEITYEITSTVDSSQRLSIQTDTAGTTDAIETVHATFELQGTNRTTISAKIETAEIPTQTSPNSATFKDYVRTIVPALSDIADADLVIESASRTGELPNYITKGPVPDWVDDDVEDDTQEFVISAQIRKDGDPAGDIVQTIRHENYRVTLKTTDKQTGTFTKTTSFDTGETVPTGVATALYNAWNTLHHEGSFSYTLEEVDGLCTPGKVFNITGGSSAINSKAAIIQGTSEEIDTGTTSIRFGPPRRLEADTLIGLFRALRSRRYSVSKSAKTDPSITSTATEVTGAAAERWSSSANKQKGMEQFIKENETDELEHKITLDPSLVTFADDQYNTDAGEPTAKDIKPLECFILVKSGTGLAAQRVQLMGCTPYGDTITILPDGLTEGDLLVFGSEQLGRLAIGSNNDYLKSNGTTAAWESPTEGCE